MLQVAISVKGAVEIYSIAPPSDLGFIILNGFYSKQYKETHSSLYHKGQ